MIVTHSVITQTLLSHAGVPTFETLSLNPNMFWYLFSCYQCLAIAARQRVPSLNRNTLLITNERSWSKLILVHISIIFDIIQTIENNTSVNDALL